MKIFERSVEVWKDWIRLKKELATLGEELPRVELLPAERKKLSLESHTQDTLFQPMEKVLNQTTFLGTVRHSN